MVTLMSYDYHELNRTSINAPLSRENNQNPYTETVAENVERVLSQGCRPEKVVMGIPTYGRTYTLLNANNAGVDAAVEGPGEPGPFTLSQGSLGFNEVRHERERRKKPRNGSLFNLRFVLRSASLSVVAGGTLSIWRRMRRRLLCEASSGFPTTIPRRSIRR